MIRFAAALGLAVLAHLVVFVVAGHLIMHAAAPVPLPELQATTVELSFSERDEAEGAVGAPAASSDIPTPVPPVAEHKAEPLPELPVRDEGVFPKVPQAAVESCLPAPDVPEAPETVPNEVDTRRVDCVASDSGVPESVPVESTRETARVDVPPQPRTAFRPTYPRGCRARGEEGVVMLLVEVSAGGMAASVRVDVTSGFPELDAAAIAAVRRAGFVPATRDGHAVAGTVRLPVAFRLRP